MKISNYSGTLLTVTGILHLLVVLILFGDTYLRMISDGLFNSIGEDCMRAAATWDFVVGILLILCGMTLQFYQKQTKKAAPVFMGYVLLVLSVLLCIVMPISGAWLFIPQGVIILVAYKRKIA